MDIKLLELHFSQLAKSWSKSKFNNYSDKKKQAYKNELASLFNKLEKEDFSQLNSNQVLERSYIIDFFVKSVEFLDSSTLNLIPFEIVECLNSALREWMNDEQDYIIVTSLVNDPTGFSFDPSLAINNFHYTTIKEVYGIEFSRKLIQINLPRFLVKDYLSNVVLYHELGHFIDMKYNICEAVYIDIYNKYFTNSFSPEEKENIRYFFPYIDALHNNFLNHQYSSILHYHIEEYFCDLFASQYIGDSSNHYLNYITKQQSKFGSSHPATTHRIEFVNKFLNKDISCFFLNLLKDAVLQITQREIQIRYKEVEDNDFIKLLPVLVTTENQLHYLFILGWKTWLGNWHEIQSLNNMQFNIQGHQVYTIINNLIEKSVNTFIVNQSWNRANALAQETNTKSY